jgi:GT2 family glycosyltransferase
MQELIVNKKMKILFFVERDLQLPFLEPIFDYFNTNYDFELALITPPFVSSTEGNPGRGLPNHEVQRLKQKCKFINDPSVFNPDLTYVADVSFSLKNCGKVINVGHGLISKGGFYKDAPIVRRENLADLICVPGEWHKQILEKNIFVPIVATGFIKSDKMFGANKVQKSDFCKKYNISESAKIILFAPTFNKELSSIPVLEDKIGLLANYNTVLLIKLHSMTDVKYVDYYRNLALNNPNIRFIDDIDLTPSLVAADVLISDVSSAVAEFLILNKPVIVVNNPNLKQYSYYDPNDIEYKIREGCIVVNNFDELKSSVGRSLEYPNEFEAKRKFYSSGLCLGKDGFAAKRAAESGIDLINGKFKSKNGLDISVIIGDDDSIPQNDLNRKISELEQIVDINIEIILLSNRKIKHSNIKVLPDDITIQQLLGNINGDYLFFDDLELNFPSNYLRTLMFYFKWYSDTFAVECITESDNYLGLVKEYFPKIHPENLSEVQFNLRYFIANDIKISELKGLPTLLNVEKLKQRIEISSNSDLGELIPKINKLAKNNGLTIRKAVDVFAYKQITENHNPVMITENRNLNLNFEDELLNSILKNIKDISQFNYTEILKRNDVFIAQILELKDIPKFKNLLKNQILEISSEISRNSFSIKYIEDLYSRCKFDDELKEIIIKLIENDNWNLDLRQILYKFQQSKLPEKNVEISPKPNKFTKLTSIIILAKDQSEYTKECIDSIYKFTPEPFELVLVDNGSRDNIPNYFRELQQNQSNVKVITNHENVGFPKGVNQGLRASTGDYVLIGNNDTIVTPGWLNRMIEAIEANSNIGLVGPISNNISGLQLDKNAIYTTLDQMLEYADQIKKNFAGKFIEFPRLAFFCTLIKREVIDKIGGLDERFSPGNYEDDDFCMRAQVAGYKAHILRDVFIHHYRSRSFVDDGNDAYRQRLIRNRGIFADKWGGTPDEIWLEGKSIYPPELYVKY